MTAPELSVPLDVGHGPVLLLLHAFPFDHRMWDDDAQALAAGWRVIAPDLPGFGASAPLPGPVATMDAMAAGVAELLDRRAIRPAAVVGASMGGYVALALAEHRPELVPALVLVDSRARADLALERANRLQQADLLEGPDTGGHEFFAGTTLARVLGPAAPEPVVARVRGWIDEAQRAPSAAALRGMAARPDREAVLRAFTGPLLAIGGEHDAITPPSEIAGLAALAPAGRAEVVRAAGHLPNLEQPTEVRALIRAFLADVTRNGSPEVPGDR